MSTTADTAPRTGRHADAGRRGPPTHGQKHASARSGRCPTHRRGPRTAFPQVTSDARPDSAGMIVGSLSYYDPTTAQFTTLDPLVHITEEPYGYTGGNPANWSDPWGLSRELCEEAGGEWVAGGCTDPDNGQQSEGQVASGPNNAGHLPPRHPDNDGGIDIIIPSLHVSPFTAINGLLVKLGSVMWRAQQMVKGKGGSIPLPPFPCSVLGNFCDWFDSDGPPEADEWAASSLRGGAVVEIGLRTPWDILC